MWKTVTCYKIKILNVIRLKINSKQHMTGLEKIDFSFSLESTKSCIHWSLIGKHI